MRLKGENKKVMISDDERLITLTKKAYDEMNEKIIKLENEIDNNTIRLYAHRERSYYPDDEHLWRRVTVSVHFPDSIKSIVEEFKEDCESIKIDIDRRLEKLALKSMDLEDRERLIKDQKILPKWILKLFGIKVK